MNTDFDLPPPPAGIGETGNRTPYEPVSPDGRPESGRRYTVPARAGRALRLEAGERLKVVNPHGTQVGDAWAFNADDLDEHLSMEHLRAALGRLSPLAGDALVTNRRRPILTLLEDSSPGVHDTLIAACDPDRYRLLGVEGYHDNCADNLRMAMAAIGLRAPRVPAPLNLWMNIPVTADGSLRWEPPVSAPEDYVVLRAEMDCIFVVSACPQDRVPVNGADCLPRELAVERLT